MARILQILMVQTLYIGAALLVGLSPPVARADRIAPVFDGHSGERSDWSNVYAAMDKADIVIVGEQHTDAAGHALQVRIITDVLERWDNVVLTLEEFDRSQQGALDDYQNSEITGVELKGVRDFVDPQVRRNWLDWYLPKLEAARQGGASLMATNAPLKYSRMVRNAGCDNLPELPQDERSLFDCPVAPLDPEYRERFGQTMKSVAAGNRSSGLKPLKDEQIDKMFRAHRVWDATMARSIVEARSDGRKVMHLVGSFHSDYSGGLVQELRSRDPEASILVLCLTPKRGFTLSRDDIDRADFVVYTKN
jgi:uncharacterized iron-regulated protein